MTHGPIHRSSVRGQWLAGIGHPDGIIVSSCGEPSGGDDTHIVPRLSALRFALAVAVTLWAVGLSVPGVVTAATTGQCLRDAAGFSQPNICVSSDVRVARFDVIGTCSGGGANGARCAVGVSTDPCVLQGGTCVGVTDCTSGQPVSVPIRATIVSGAATRFDIGFFIAEDGGDAKGNPSTIPHGGTCLRDFLHPVSATNGDLQLTDGDGPYFNAEIGASPPDACGDIRQSDGNNVYDFATITLQCQDTNADGFLDVAVCVSWEVNGNSTCNSELDAVPSATSKCRCESIKVGTVAICGDGVVNASAGEQCDQGAANGTPGSCCSSTCTFKSAGTVCRPGSGDVCDPDEKCTGTSADCPVDSVAPIATVCRPAGGECDVTETCSGVARQPCPGDGKQPPGTQCTDDGNLCTLDQCDGTSVSCQHPAGDPGVVCRRGSGGPRDPDETFTRA